MNKIVKLVYDNFVSEFPETIAALEDLRSVNTDEYVKTVEDYYENNCGVSLFNWFNGTKNINAYVTDESKFALFMLQYPHHIEKIVYE